MWFAIQTWPRYEKQVARELGRKSVEVFLPLFAAEHQWSDRRRVVYVPLFPTYLFVQTAGTPETRTVVVRTRGVIGFLGARTGTPVPESEIDSVRILLDRDVAFQNHPFLNVGQRVRIREGSLDGVEGILVAKNDDFSLIVSINIIQRSLAVRVAGYRVEAA